MHLRFSVSRCRRIGFWFCCWGILGVGIFGLQVAASGPGVVEPVPVDNPDPDCSDLLSGELRDFAVVPETGLLYACGTRGFLERNSGNECGPESTDAVFVLEDGPGGVTLVNVSNGYLAGSVSALTVFEGRLYAGGGFNDTNAFNGTSGVLGRVAVFDPGTSSWAMVGNGLGGTPVVSGDEVLALEVYKGELYAVGSFSQTLDGATSLRNIAKLDQENDVWVDVGGGLDGIVYDLTVLRGSACDSATALVAVGAFDVADPDGEAIDAYRMVLWNGYDWFTIGPNTHVAEDGGFSSVLLRTVAVYNDGEGPSVYVGGSITLPHPDHESEHNTFQNSYSVVRLKPDRSAWTGISGGLWNQSNDAHTVRSLVVYDDGSGAALYAGGAFDRAGGNKDAWIFTGDDDYLGISVAGLARYRNLQVGWEAASLNPDKPGNSVFAMKAYDDGLGNGLQLYLGGDFNPEPTNQMKHIARLTGCHGQEIDPQVGAPVMNLGVVAAGCRYLEILPGTSGSLFKIGVVDSSGAERFLTAPIDDEHGRFASLTENFGEAEARTAAEWGCSIFVTGDLVIPSETLEARAYFDGQAVSGGFATTWVWGDADQDGVASFADVQLAVQAFQNDFSNVTLTAVDIGGCLPDGLANFVDIQAFVVAFQQTPFEDYLAGACGGSPKK